MPAALREVFFCISRAFYAYIACLEQLLAENDLAKHVRPGMGHVLFALFDQDDVIIKNLVQRTELSPSALTRLLTDMERRGLLTRHRDTHDGRATRVRLTRLGRSLEKRCNQTRAEVHRIIYGNMRDREINAVVRGLTQMISNLRSQDRLPQ
jgi:DNA-binding MarR family transcriptional regulator